MSGLIQGISDDDLDRDILASTTPVLIDFWAEWCAPCRALQPTLEDVAETYGDALRVVKIDVVANPRAAERFGARAIPLVVLLVEGKERGRVTGALSRTRLCHFIDGHLGDLS